jgi:hypothetical protein
MEVVAQSGHLPYLKMLSCECLQNRKERVTCEWSVGIGCWKRERAAPTFRARVRI